MRRRQAQATVKDVVGQLGGSIQAAAKGFTTTATVYKAMRDKRVRLSSVVLLWAEALEPTDPKARWQLARQLAGLD
jgi:hypothetical protein